MNKVGTSMGNEWANREKVLQNKTIVMGITGGIAAYKAADIASKLTQEGAKVKVLMTREAQEFVTPLTFASLTGQPVTTDMFASVPRISHVALGQEADIVVIAPATANIIARIAAGIADDVLTCTVLATQAPVLIAPAMHAAMYQNQATQQNIARLKERVFYFVGPAVGRLASGHFGPGRFADNADVIGAIYQILGKKGDLTGKRIVVTAGGTQEPIDPVRYISNYSSGKMGYAIATAARDRGAEVTLITTPTALPVVYGVTVVPVKTAVDMQKAVNAATAKADAIIMAAAVADFQAASTASQKIKRGKGELTLKLTPTPDILKGIKGNLIKVGFAAESENLLRNAKRKLREKKLHLIVANDITASDSGFGSDNNRVTIIDQKGKAESLPLLPKSTVAHLILDRVAGLLNVKKR
jgi:phosphopantothenoylcysteine decarboxylase/phosphopantothenate--cysteine ligase